MTKIEIFRLQLKLMQDKDERNKKRTENEKKMAECKKKMKESSKKIKKLKKELKKNERKMAEILAKMSAEELAHMLVCVPNGWPEDLPAEALADYLDKVEDELKKKLKITSDNS